jgi:RNA polymerase sigma factor (sigma-70 family)
LSAKAESEIDSEHLFEKYKPLIRSALTKYNYGQHGIDYDDLLQEIRIRLWAASKRDIDRRRISAYIRKIVDSVLINHLNIARKNREIIRQSETVLRMVHSRELEQIILECADTLIESRRMVISLYLSGFTVADIAKALNWTIGKTSNLHSRGLKDLKKKLMERGINYEIK